MVLIKLPSEVLERGLQLVGFTIARQSKVGVKKNLERFAAHFQSKPIVYAVLWGDLQTTDIDEALIRKDGEEATDLDFDRFLIAIHYLANYPTENELEAKFGYSDRTVRGFVWEIIGKVQALKAEKIVWPLDWKGATFIVSVDGVHCAIQEPSHGNYSKNPKYYSHKFKAAALAYEIAISIYDGNCVWVNGPFKAGKSDMSIFRCALKAMIPAGKLVVADHGYKGEDAIISRPSSHDVPAVRTFKGRARACQESFNGRIKRFRCLTTKFRHDARKHQLCFDAVCVIAQYQIENGSPLFKV